EVEVVDGDGLAGPQLDVAVVAGVVAHGHVVPGQPGAPVQEGWLVGLDGEQVVRLLAGHQELGRRGVGLQRVGGHDHARKIETGEHRLEGGDLPGAPLTSRWARTTRGVWSITASRCTWPPSSRRAPRRVLPSTATARRRWPGSSRST